MEYTTVSFLGHRKIDNKETTEIILHNVIENMILHQNANAFLFGSRSEFDDLCHRIVTEFKQIYPHIERIYIRAEYPYIRESYEKYLLQRYEHTYYPEQILNSGRVVYIKRNFEMIDKSDFCIFYYNQQSLGKSGTKTAYEYAKRKKRDIINVFTK